MRTLFYLGWMLALACSEAMVAQTKSAASKTHSSADGWAKDQPDHVRLDEKIIQAFDSDLARGKYGLVDSFGVYRCGKNVFEQSYPTITARSTANKRTNAVR